MTRGAVVPLAVLMLLGIAGTARGEPPVRIDLDVHRVLWPVIVEPRPAGDADDCRSIRPADVLVTEDGVVRPVTSIVPEPPRTLHAILVDVSGSMEGALAEARRAAGDYLDALDAGEPVALFSFSDEVRLLAAPTVDRSRIRAALRRLAPVHGTALWDALAAALEMLSAWSRRKAVLLVTDGADTSSLAATGPDDALERSGIAGAVTVFPVLLGRGSRAARGPRAPRFLLHRLAAGTGGSLLEVPDAAHFRRALDDIRTRLGREWTIAYVAPAPGGPVRTPPRVRVRARRGAPCRVRSAGPPRRRAIPPGSRVRARAPRIEPGEWRAAGLRGAGTPATALGLEPSPRWPADGEAVLAWPAGRRLGLVRWTAVATARGHLLDPRRQRPGRRPRTREVPAARFAPRDASILVPPREVLESSIHGLADALMAARGHGLLAAAGGDPGRPGDLAPILWDGATFLAYRLALAEALVRTRDDLARFAAERIARLRLGELLGLERASSGPVTPARRRALESAAAHAARQAPPALRARFVAAWLPGVEALDLAVEVERRAPLAPDAGTARAWLSLREELGTLLPLPFHRRSVVLGVPQYDPELDAIGFRPIHLTRLTVRRRLEGALPPVPLAWTALRELTVGPDAPAGGFAPREIHLSRLDPSLGAPALRGRAQDGRRETRWVLDARGAAPDARLLVLVELAAGVPSDPSVRIACASTRRRAWAARLARSGLLCTPRWGKRLAERADRG